MLVALSLLIQCSLPLFRVVHEFIVHPERILPSNASNRVNFVSFAHTEHVCQSEPSSNREFTETFRARPHRTRKLRRWLKFKQKQCNLCIFKLSWRRSNVFHRLTAFLFNRALCQSSCKRQIESKPSFVHVKTNQTNPMSSDMIRL